jgi:D-3-phosphoglycerate dehydrogenase
MNRTPRLATHGEIFTGLSSFYAEAAPAEADILLIDTHHRATMANLEMYPNLRILVSPTTTDRHIDMSVCANRDIKVITLKDCPEVLKEVTPAAEFTLALILALTRNLVPSANAVGMNEDPLPKWNRYDWGGERMASASDLGIIGNGRLGNMVADLARPMFRSVSLLPAPSAITDNARNTLPGLHVVSIHLPPQQNRRAINGDFLGCLRPGTYLVNTSQSEVIDELAVVDALRSKRLAGYATDCYQGEFEGIPVTGSPIWKAMKEEEENILMTPHIGGSTKDAWAMTQKAVLDRALEVWQKLP